jgi:hypothetical protein
LEDGDETGTVQGLLGHFDVSAMMVHMHVLNRTALGVRTPSGSDVSDSDWPQAVASNAVPITFEFDAVGAC